MATIEELAKATYSVERFADLTGFYREDLEVGIGLEFREYGCLGTSEYRKACVAVAFDLITEGKINIATIFFNYLAKIEFACKTTEEQNFYYLMLENLPRWEGKKEWMGFDLGEMLGNGWVPEHYLDIVRETKTLLLGA